MRGLPFAFLLGWVHAVAIEMPGLIVFDTHVSAYAIDAPVFRPDGSPAGEGFTAGLFRVWGDGSLAPLLPFTNFRATEASGYVKDTVVTVPNGFLANVTVRMRAWETVAGSYETALIRGESNDVLIPNLHDLNPAVLIGLEGFTMQVVPEPSPEALGLAGLALIWLTRRDAPRPALPASTSASTSPSAPGPPERPSRISRPL